MIKVYRSMNECLLVKDERQYHMTRDLNFDELFRSPDPVAYVEKIILDESEAVDPVDVNSSDWLAPVGQQEIWAAGVTYYRSREARMEEAESSGGDVFYDLVYEAARPELFFKATARRARGHRALIRVRGDSSWDVPEPELTLAINSAGRIFGYTIGNDVSSRSIEGENPLYLPQAKVYAGSCALGPALCIGPSLDLESRISLVIRRGGDTAFEGETRLSQIKRPLEELADYLFRENEFPDGAYLMTGTGVVPSSDFTLQSGDEVEITIEGLGVLVNAVE